MNYLLGSGYYTNSEFAITWLKRICDSARPKPEKIVIVSVGGERFPKVCFEGFTPNWRDYFSEVNLAGNLGHVGDLLKGKDRDFCGWSAAVITLAMIAYTAELDFIFCESDTLAFGPWVEKLYSDMNDADMVFGGKMESEPFMACAQGLFLIRHRFIPTFVSKYIQMGSDSRLYDGKSDNLPEDKFHRLREAMPDKIKTLSFGVDRQRPLPIDSPVWYAQHFTPEELTLMQEKGLL